MKKIFSFFLVYVSVMNFAMGYALHVGNTTLNLFDTEDMNVVLPNSSTVLVPRRTQHSLNVIGPDDHTYFIDMIPTFVPNSLHTVFDDTLYSSCLIATGFYCIRDGILYWGDPEIYLLSDRTQYINTNYVPTVNTAVEMVMADKSSLTYDLFGVENGGAAGINTGFGISLDNGKFGFFRNRQSIDAINKDDQFHYYYLSNTDAILDDTHYDFPSAKEPIDISRPMYAFGFNHVGAAYDKAIAMKWLKIYENGVLVRHFVPVPKDLVIGDFTVPSNGFFEIVEQKFYANGGTGDFDIDRDGGVF